MTRALDTISANAFAPTITSAKTVARACTFGHRQVGVRPETDADANALAARCALR